MGQRWDPTWICKISLWLVVQSGLERRDGWRGGGQEAIALVGRARGAWDQTGVGSNGGNRDFLGRPWRCDLQGHSDNWRWNCRGAALNGLVGRKMLR